MCPSTSTSLATAGLVLFPALLVAGAGAFIGGFSADICSGLAEMEPTPTKNLIRGSMVAGMAAGAIFGLLAALTVVGKINN